MLLITCIVKVIGGKTVPAWWILTNATSNTVNTSEFAASQSIYSPERKIKLRRKVSSLSTGTELYANALSPVFPGRCLYFLTLSEKFARAQLHIIRKKFVRLDFVRRYRIRTGERIRTSLCPRTNRRTDVVIPVVTPLLRYGSKRISLNTCKLSFNT